MGFYIETGTAKFKVQALKKQFDAEVLTEEEVKKLPAHENGLVCVIENTFFDAAAFLYSDREKECFLNDNTGRKKTFLKIDRRVAIRESGYTAN